ncbi:glycosyltransferase [Halomonas sp. ZH2S]|uniref:Glycosyltransferase n=1 Tax=Vreelandella zhuhanensis TaxID=2684210 RepID=A0A7X3GZA4_9GAMM|nr:glycosyltransferase family 2 protein [Halomonas zhuhanensis]MWJ27637.1 glycosyltransferase [Halomonas zhuhanensis]
MKSEMLVLLAAYNGQKYIREQLLSIFESEGCLSVSVLIGLDPSSDSTELVVEEFEGESCLVIKNKEPSGGAKNNFSLLVEHALDSDNKYFAFSDQDDVWDADKLSLNLDNMREMELLYGANAPVLVFSDSRVVSESMEMIETSFMKAESLNPDFCDDFKRLVIHNVGQGCTFLFNRALLELAAPVPDGARMHDHWFMLVACALGKISYIPKPLLSYRQHSTNVVGAHGHGVLSSIEKFLFKKQSIVDSIIKNQKQAEVFLNRYGDLLDKNQATFLRKYSSLSRESLLYRKIFCIKHRLAMSDSYRTAGFYLFR